MMFYEEEKKLGYKRLSCFLKKEKNSLNTMCSNKVVMLYMCFLQYGKSYNCKRSELYFMQDELMSSKWLCAIECVQYIPNQNSRVTMLSHVQYHQTKVGSTVSHVHIYCRS